MQIIEQIMQMPPIISFAASFGFGLYIFFNRRRDEKKHQTYIKKTINNNVLEFVKITSVIHTKSENVHDSDEQAMLLESYFSRHIRRLELLRLNIENKLPQLVDNSDYTNDVKHILDIQSWLVEKYDDPTIPKDKRFYLWKDDYSGELTTKTRNLLNIAQKMNIEKPTTIT